MARNCIQIAQTAHTQPASFGDTFLRGKQTRLRMGERPDDRVRAELQTIGANRILLLAHAPDRRRNCPLRSDSRGGPRVGSNCFRRPLHRVQAHKLTPSAVDIAAAAAVAAMANGMLQPSCMRRTSTIAKGGAIVGECILSATKRSRQSLARACLFRSRSIHRQAESNG